MSLTGKILTGILFVVLPVIAGGIYSPFLVKRIKLHFADICKLLIRTAGCSRSCRNCGIYHSCFAYKEAWRLRSG